MVDVRWDLDDRNNYNNRIASWLATPAIVENVKFNGKTWFLAGMPMPKIKARTCFMVMEVCSPDLALFCTLLSLLPSSCWPAFLSHHTIKQLISLLISGQVQEGLECASRARTHRHG